MAKNQMSHFLSFVLRHKPEVLGLEMDRQGWVSVEALLDGINAQPDKSLSMAELEAIVAQDAKGRYRFNEDRSKIKACQGHTIPWVEPVLTVMSPPAVLYHGTTAEAWAQIQASGAVHKMKRHAVHMQAELAKAWQAARRWHKTPVVLEIDTAAMARDGFCFGVTENAVWCTEKVPVQYIASVHREKGLHQTEQKDRID